MKKGMQGNGLVQCEVSVVAFIRRETTNKILRDNLSQDQESTAGPPELEA
jgi:hypothetical protein